MPPKKGEELKLPEPSFVLESEPVSFFDKKFVPLSLYYKEINPDDLALNFIKLEHPGRAETILQDHQKKLKDEVERKEHERKIERVVQKARKEGRSESDCRKIREDEYTKFEMEKIIQVLEKPALDLDVRLKKQQEWQVLHQKLWFKAHRRYDKERCNELAKPVDKWRVLRQLIGLYKEFQHDRVLERIIRTEIAKS